MIARLARALAALLLAAAFPAAAQELPNRAGTLAAMERMADWQLAHLDDLSYISALRSDTSDPRDWQQATFWVALTRLADRSASPRFRDAILATGRKAGWRLGDRLHHADDQLIGAAWLWAAAHGVGAEAIQPMRAQIDRMLAEPATGSLEFPEDGSGKPDCADRWCWCDALFMAPPTLWELSAVTGDRRYRAHADAEYFETWRTLFDPEERLFYRDSRFLARRGAHGEKLFWSRGNGWVMSGLARLIPALPPQASARPFYSWLFTEMADRIVTLQRPNGFWPPSLLGDSASAPDESSGTGFYVHALAWGIKAGMLERGRYLPAVVRGWAALQRAIQPDGRLGWVQQVSDRPDAVAANDTQFYGVGAYLLAGAAVHDLAEEAR